MDWWYWWFALSIGAACSTLFAVFWRIRQKTRRILSPIKIGVIGTFVSATLLLIPIYLVLFSDAAIANWWRAILSACQHAIRLFAFDGGYMELLDEVIPRLPSSTLQMWYTVILALFYVVAPFLTFGVVLSVFKNFFAYVRYYLGFWKYTHVFSELNEKTLALAKNIMQRERRERREKKGFHPFSKERIVFTDVLDREDEEGIELIEEAKTLGAILFSKDIELIRYRRLHSLRQITFYLISEDEEEKIRHAEGLIKTYRNCSQTKLYLFSDNVVSKTFLDSYSEHERQEMRLEVVRVNDIRALIYHNLDENGLELFENAKQYNDGTREICAVVVGLGRYGMETIKALLWYSQLPGYRVKITAFDEREEAPSIFLAACPSIVLDRDMNSRGDMRYSITIKKAVFGTDDFLSAIEALEDTTYVFVCLGDDNQNLAAAVSIRSRLMKKGIVPDIDTVVYDSSLKNRMDAVWEVQSSVAGLSDGKQKKNRTKEHSTYGESFSLAEDCDVSKALSAEKRNARKKRKDARREQAEQRKIARRDFKGIKHTLEGDRSEAATKTVRAIREKNVEHINIIGDLDSFYSEETVINSQLIQEGLEVHRRWNITERAFYMNDYNFYSSVASALHRRLRRRIVEECTEQTHGAVFPFYFSSVPDPYFRSQENVAELLKELLPQTVNEKLVKELSDKMKAFGDSLNAALGRIHYEKLGVTERGELLNRLQRWALTKNDVPPIPMLKDREEYLAGYREYLEAPSVSDKEKWEKWPNRIFTMIVEKRASAASTERARRAAIYSLEYEALSPEERAEVADYVRRRLGEEGDAEALMKRYIGYARAFAMIEHVRWNAYMRTEGFQRAQDRDMPRKYKLHYDLVPISMLTVADCIKDI